MPLAEGKVYSCGNGGFGQLGHGNKADLDSPKKIGTIKIAIVVSTVLLKVRLMVRISSRCFVRAESN